MSVNPISQANGADLLALISQSTGKGAPVQSTATMSAIKTAIAEAQLSIEELLNASDAASIANVTGNNLNVMA